MENIGSDDRVRSHFLLLTFVCACSGPMTSTPKYVPQKGCQKVDCAELFEGMKPLDPNGDDDQDGVLNSVDGAPLIPEDKDGVDDKDGIPDPDPPPAPKPKKGEKVKEDTIGPPNDIDADSIPDAYDMCPKEAEDMDKFEDIDGCPEPDNDKDGMLDPVDPCPNVPGKDCK